MNLELNDKERAVPVCTSCLFFCLPGLKVGKAGEALMDERHIEAEGEPEEGQRDGQTD